MPDKIKSKSFEDDLSPMSLEQFHSEINRALEDSANDRMIKVSDLKAKI